MNKCVIKSASNHIDFVQKKTYLHWAREYFLYHNPELKQRKVAKNPTEMGAPEIQVFLPCLAQDKHVAASTQNQALSALLFLYKNVLQQEIDQLPSLVHAG